jgi:hypothetical protein
MQRSPEMTNFLKTVFGDCPEDAHAEQRCVVAPIGCGGPVGEFRDALSRREYSISGLCQKCQDELFGTGD